MKFDAKIMQVTTQRVDAVVVAVFESRHLGDAARALDAASGGALSRELKRSAFTGKSDQVLVLRGLAVLPAGTVVLAGLGERGDVDDSRMRRAQARVAETLADSGCASVANFLTTVPVKGRDARWCARVAVEALRTATYRFERLKSARRNKHHDPVSVLLAVSDDDATKLARRGIREGQAIADGADLARDLGNLPGNICTPGYLAAEARRLARRFETVTARVLNEAQMKRAGMGALLSVAAGSDQPPRLIALEYRGAGARAPSTVLVGKGVTFDSGGISIKPAAAMDEMKFDMCGAASVLGALLTAASLRLAINLVVVIPATENLPGGRATKPGDVVTTLSGQTVEILNTDAEGRLILCDALTWAARYKPEVVIDVATLTGACVVALGAHASGLFANDDALAEALLAAGETSGDRAWRLPVWEDYQEALNSNFADFANVGGREGGAITAAAFLSRFTKKYRWAHLDIAGTAWRSGKTKGATARPVMLLAQYLIDRTGRRAG